MVLLPLLTTPFVPLEEVEEVWSGEVCDVVEKLDA